MAYLTVQLFNKRRFKKLLIILLLFTFGSALIISPLESSHPERQINGLFDGIWWAIQTITTVGYGDVVPVSPLGRLLGIFLQIVGSTIYSILFVVVGSTLSESTDYYHWNKLFQRLDELEKNTEANTKSVQYLVSKTKKTPGFPDLN